MVFNLKNSISLHLCSKHSWLRSNWKPFNFVGTKPESSSFLSWYFPGEMHWILSESPHMMDCGRPLSLWVKFMKLIPTGKSGKKNLPWTSLTFLRSKLVSDLIGKNCNYSYFRVEIWDGKVTVHPSKMMVGRVSFPSGTRFKLRYPSWIQFTRHYQYY